MTVLCKDCKHHKPFSLGGWNGTFDNCKYNPKINIVTGAPEYRFCDIERRSGYRCGIEGKNFVPKDQNLLTQPEKPVSFWSKLKFWN